MSDKNEKLLLKIYEEVVATKEGLEALQGKTIPEMQEQLKAIPKMQEQLNEIQMKSIPEMQEQINKMQRQLNEIQMKTVPEIQCQIKEIKQEVCKISGSVARIEVEHGEKLVALFDAFKINTEKIEQQNERIEKCEKAIERHDDEIYLLKTKIQEA